MVKENKHMSEVRGIAAAAVVIVAAVVLEAVIVAAVVVEAVEGLWELRLCNSHTL
jgi:hypothetical protein